MFVPVDELLAIVSWPDTAPAAVGSNFTFSVAVCPAFKVSGKFSPEVANSAPVTVAEFTVTAALPVDDNVRVWVAVSFISTFPNAIDVALTLSVLVPDGDSWTEKDAVAPPAVAVKTAVWAELTAATVAEKPALVAPAATVTLGGTDTAELPLASPTLNPPVGAAVVSVTVQESVPAAAIDEDAQETAAIFPAVVAEALMLTRMLPCLALLAMVRTPVYAFAWEDMKLTVSVAVWPGFSVNGAATPEVEKADPVFEIPEIVTGAVPVEESVSDCDAVCPTLTLPKLTVDKLTLRVGTAAFN